MPELPEVETVRRGLVPFVLNKKIVQMIPEPGKCFQGEVENVNAARVVELRRKGKALLIDLDNGYTKDLKDNVILFKEIRDILALKYPYSKCENYQQDILIDIDKLKTNGNETVVDNISRRIEDEFLKLTGDNKKNKRNNTISTLIGVVGILISILMGIIKF